MNNMQFVKTSKGVDIRLGGGYLSVNGTPIATYPIGTIVENVDPNYSPAKEYGGTWERFGQGKVLVGFDENDADFNEVLKTGGEKKHTLSISELSMRNRELYPLVSHYFCLPPPIFIGKYEMFFSVADNSLEYKDMLRWVLEHQRVKF